MPISKKLSQEFLSTFPFPELMDILSDMIFIMRVDHDGVLRYAYVNQSATRFSGVTEEDYGKTILDVYPNDMGLFLQDKYSQVVKTRQTIRMEDEFILPNGKWSGESVLTPVLDDDGNCVYVFSITRDITERKEHERMLKAQSFEDDLTGLPNRRYIRETFLEADLDFSQYAVFSLDLDRFKYINDTLGHDIGDKLLRLAAERLKIHFARYGLIARLGGDEFILITEKKSKKHCEMLASKILETFQVPYQIEGYTLYVSVSVGVAIGQKRKYADAKALVKYADIALNQAKEDGRSRYVIFEEKAAEEYQSRFQLEHALYKAIQNKEFCVCYQPIVDAMTGSWAGLEALIRWVHPEAGVISPLTFIPVAEETGLISHIGEWVLRQVCEDLKTWEKQGLANVRVSVNISRVQFQQSNLVERMEEILGEYQVSPSQIGLEVTESVAFHDLREVKSKLCRLANKGFYLSIDDFGTGYSSLNLLSELPVHAVKIDKSFIQNDDGASNSLVKAMIAMANALGLRVVAEGVETEEQVKRLRHAGCHQLQGYYFSKPLPAKEWTRIRSGEKSGVTTKA